MNKIILMGRLTRDPEVRYSQSDPSSAIARYTLAVTRNLQKARQPMTSALAKPHTRHRPRRRGVTDLCPFPMAWMMNCHLTDGNTSQFHTGRNEG